MFGDGNKILTAPEIAEFKRQAGLRGDEVLITDNGMYLPDGAYIPAPDKKELPLCLELLDKSGSMSSPVRPMWLGTPMDWSKLMDEETAVDLYKRLFGVDKPKYLDKFTFYISDGE